MTHLSILFIFLRLGCTSFGGPIAHLGYFRDEFVVRKQWLTEEDYANLIALCQFIPGPASSQVGAAIGYQRAGYLGALSAWIGFTLPSAVLMVLFALSLGSLQDASLIDWFHGLKLVAVAVVAQAIWGMQKQLCSTLFTRLLAISAVAVLLVFPWQYMQLMVILGGVLAGLLVGQRDATSNASLQPNAIQNGSSRSRFSTVLLLSLFVLGLIGIPAITANSSGLISLFDSLYRAGALVFGGGHVVLPLLFSEMVPSDLVTESDFFLGYGAAQALPGPLFTFATFLGAASANEQATLAAGVATIAIFIPGMLLLFAALPHWQTLSQHRLAKRSLIGVNAAVVGLLLAALVNPIIVTTIGSLSDVVIVALAITALIRFQVHPVWVIGGCLIANTLVMVLFT